MTMILSQEVDFKLVEKITIAMTDVMRKLPKMRFIMNETGDEETQIKPKENPILKALIKEIGELLLSMRVSRTHFVKTVKNNPSENLQAHCICCSINNPDHGASNLENSGETSPAKNDNEEYKWKELTDAIADFQFVVKSFSCFRSRYTEVHQLLQNVEKILENYRQILKTNTKAASCETEIETETEEMHCDCCSKKEMNKAHDSSGALDPDSGTSSASGSRSDPAKSKKFKSTLEENIKDREQGQEESPDVESEEEIPPEQKAFSVDLILEQVLRNCTPRTLLSCRLINRRWSALCNKILLQSQALQTTVIFWDNLDSTKAEDLEGILEVLEKSTSFPSTSFRFFGGPLNFKLMQKLLNKFGSLMKTFSIDFDSQKDRMRSSITLRELKFFKKLLTVQLPNVHTLSINNHPNLYLLNLDFQIPVHSKNQELMNENLKFLDIGTGVPRGVLEVILQVSRNLEEITWDAVSDKTDGRSLCGSGKEKKYFLENCKWLLPTLFKFDKVHLIKSIGMHWGPRGGSDSLWTKFGDSTAPLKKICIDFEPTLVIREQEFPNISQCLKKILEKSRDTLEDLDICPLGFLPGFRIPILSKLDTLKLSLTGNEGEGNANVDLNGKYFPPGFILSHTFPNVRKINVKIDFGNNVHKDYDWKRNFNTGDPQDHIYEGVKELYFSKCPPLDWLKRMAGMFPGCEKITVRNQVKDVTQVMQCLCKFSHLKHLVVGYRVNYKACQFPSLDSVFSGFSRTDCYGIYEDDVKDELDDGVYEECKKRRSLVDIKNLESLKIILINDWRDETRNPANLRRFPYEEPIMSHVGGEFGFKLCPLLKHVELVMKTSRHDGISLGIEKLFSGLTDLFPYVDEAQFVI